MENMTAMPVISNEFLSFILASLNTVPDWSLVFFVCGPQHRAVSFRDRLAFCTDHASAEIRGFPGQAARAARKLCSLAPAARRFCAVQCCPIGFETGIPVP
jgi:hypothetical protein